MTLKICVMGLGYIGLPTAVFFARKGVQVHGVDTSQEVLDALLLAKPHIVEPKLHEYLADTETQKNLTVSITPFDADIYMICVPTPFYDDKAPFEANLTFVDRATDMIAPFLKDGSMIILESTSPIGTTNRLRQRLMNLRNDLSDVKVAYCPERVLPGQIIDELEKNDRIVGGIDKNSAKAAADFYRLYITGKVYETDAKTAEMCKLVENSYRDVNIAFANEISMIAHIHDIDEREVIDLSNKHPRVDILNAGVGVGGHCIAVDPWFLASGVTDTAQLIIKAREVNLKKTQWVIGDIVEKLEIKEKQLRRHPTVCLLGLAYKPNVDDLRESPALQVAKAIKNRFDKFMVVEPNIKYSNEFKLVELNIGIQSADLVVILVAHDEFLNLNNRYNLTADSYVDYCGAIRSA